MRACFSFGKYWRCSRLNCNDLHVWVLALQVLTCSCDSSACTNTSYEDIYLTVCIIPDLRASCCCMCLRVSRVLELSWDKASRNLFCKFFCLGNGSLHSFSSVCKNYFCSICFQDISSLNTHGLRHGKDCLISLGSCDCCKSDSCVSGCRLDDSCAWFQHASLLCILDHCLTDSVLNASCRVKILKLNKYCSLKSFRLLYILNLYDWCVSDQFQCASVNFTHDDILLDTYLYFLIS